MNRFRGKLALLLICVLSMGAMGLAEEGAIPESPRIAALRKELKDGHPEALARFWEYVEKVGTPIVEPSGETNQLLVTFVWRADAELKNVLLVGGPAERDFLKNQLVRVGESDLFSRTYRARDDMRATYQFSPNDPLTPIEDDKNIAARVMKFRKDPLNPRIFKSGISQLSILELPAAAPQPWIEARPGVAKGEVKSELMKSEGLKNDRTVLFYTPPGFDPKGARYPLLVVFDGPVYNTVVPTPTILDNLLAEGKIPPFVAALVGNTGGQGGRDRELPCNPEFADYLAKELIPYVREHYHATDDPKRTIVSGSSYGGLASTFAALQHPEIFGNVLSQSGSYWWRHDTDVEHEWLTGQYAAKEKLPVRFHMEVGLMEAGPTPGGGPSQLVTNRHMRNVLKAKGYEVSYHEYNGGHDYLVWRGTLGDGLVELTKGWK